METKKSVTIAFVSNTAWYLKNFRINLMANFVKHGYAVIAIAPLDERFSQLFAQHNITFVPVPISGSGINPFVEAITIYRIYRVLRVHYVDLVFSFTPKGNIYSAFASMAHGSHFIPTISGLGRTYIKKTLLTKIISLLYWITHKRAKKVFFENFDDLNVFVEKKYVKFKNCQRVPGAGINLVRFEASPLLERPFNASIFMLVARLLWDKGIGEYIEAARTIKLLYPQVTFQLLGFLDVDNPSAVSRSFVDQWVDEGVVEYLGATDDVRPFIRNADCIVLPSYREGLPQSLIEAAAMMRFIIATDVPGCRDAVVDEVTGYLCLPTDSADLAIKMIKFINLPIEDRRKMSLAGRIRVEQIFNEDIVFGAYLSSLDDFLNPCSKVRTSDVTSSKSPPPG